MTTEASPSYFTFETHPDTKLCVLLFKNVSNGGDILKRLMESDKSLVEASWLNAALFPTIHPLLVAANKALISNSRGTSKTSTLHSELVFNTSGSVHITETLRRWGVSDNCKSLLVARFDATQEEIDNLASAVQGDLTHISDLDSLKDPALIKKYYKLIDQELKVGSLTDSILTRIAVRDCM